MASFKRQSSFSIEYSSFRDSISFINSFVFSISCLNSSFLYCFIVPLWVYLSLKEEALVLSFFSILLIIILFPCLKSPIVFRYSYICYYLGSIGYFGFPYPNPLIFCYLYYAVKNIFKFSFS